jgi:CheY-like chemotaxis protein
MAGRKSRMKLFPKREVQREYKISNILIYECVAGVLEMELGMQVEGGSKATWRATMATMSEEAAVLRETAPMNILIVDDEPTIRDACGEVAHLTGMKATMVATAEEAIEVLENSAVDIVLTDLMLPHTSGLELLKRVHDTHPNVPVIVLTQYGTIDSAVAATRDGRDRLCHETVPY